jgi:hypothetical protein
MGNSGFFQLSLLNVSSQPAQDPDTDVRFVRAMDGTTILEKTGLVFPKTYNFPVPAFPQERALVCWITPARYRTCHSGIFTLTDGQTLPQSPLVLRSPGKWNARFTHWNDLSPAFKPLKDVLAASNAVTVKEDGQPLGNFAGDNYDDVDEMRAILAKTALLNLFAKMNKVPVVNQPADNWFQFVQKVLVIGRERFIGIVAEEMWRLVGDIYNNIDSYPGFVRADTVLHTGNIPAPYDAEVTQMLSVKSNDPHGNLQLTMAKSEGPGTATPVFLVDADIDEDLEFFAHAQDLFVHVFSGGTHPFDVHEILFVTYGLMDLGYDLV